MKSLRPLLQTRAQKCAPVWSTHNVQMPSLHRPQRPWCKFIIATHQDSSNVFFLHIFKCVMSEIWTMTYLSLFALCFIFISYNYSFDKVCHDPSSAPAAATGPAIRGTTALGSLWPMDLKNYKQYC
jgi:hypothetical protein